VFLTITFLTSELNGQKRINWGEDPVDLGYKGTPGMVSIKVLYNPWVETQGRSGKWTKGMAGNGQVFDIDSTLYFSGETIKTSIAFVCGNPVKFLNDLDRSRTQVVLTKSLAFKPEFIKGEKGDKGDPGINGRDGEISPITIINEAGFPWTTLIIASGFVVVAYITYLVVRAIINYHEKDSSPTITPPGVDTGEVYKKQQQNWFVLRYSASF